MRLQPRCPDVIDEDTFLYKKGKCFDTRGVSVCGVEKIVLWGKRDLPRTVTV